MQERITDIEIQLAHLEQSLQELSDTMYRQQQDIDRLERKFEVLQQRLESAGETGASPDAVEKPPHY